MKKTLLVCCGTGCFAAGSAEVIEKSDIDMTVLHDVHM